MSMAVVRIVAGAFLSQPPLCPPLMSMRSMIPERVAVVGTEDESAFLGVSST